MSHGHIVSCTVPVVPVALLELELGNELHAAPDSHLIFIGEGGFFHLLELLLLLLRLLLQPW